MNANVKGFYNLILVQNKVPDLTKMTFREGDTYKYWVSIEGKGIGQLATHKICDFVDRFFVGLSAII